MRYIFIAVALLITNFLLAQTTTSVAIYKDPRIDVLLKKQAEVNNISTRSATKRRTARGYRLLIISTTNRSEALAARTKIFTNFPELKPYMWFQSPYTKVKAGNFTSRSEAQAYQKRMASVFPNGVHIMNDIVEIKPEDIPED